MADMPEKLILDACCGGRMFWFDKNNKNVLFIDKRREEPRKLCDGRILRVDPDMVADFSNMPFADSSFRMVVFDPPHLVRAGESSWMAAKYGKLEGDWKEELRRGFSECFRVLQPLGFLVFKWNEDQIKVSEILVLTDQQPLFGHHSGRKSKTHWIVFMKQEANNG